MNQNYKIGSTNLEEISNTGNVKWAEQKLDQNFIAIAQYLSDIRDVVISKSASVALNINDLNSSELILKCPISVLINVEDDIFFANSVDVDIFGEGNSELEAIDNLKESIVMYYFALKEEKNLTPQLKAKFTLLQKLVDEL